MTQSIEPQICFIRMRILGSLIFGKVNEIYLSNTEDKFFIFFYVKENPLKTKIVVSVQILIFFVDAETQSSHKNKLYSLVNLA